MVVTLAAILKYVVGCDDYRIPTLVPFPGLTVHTMYSTHIRPHLCSECKKYELFLFEYLCSKGNMWADMNMNKERNEYECAVKDCDPIQMMPKEKMGCQACLDRMFAGSRSYEEFREALKGQGAEPAEAQMTTLRRAGAFCTLEGVRVLPFPTFDLNLTCRK